jgi:serine/threonine-protein kinase PRP4
MWSVGCTVYELYTGKILFPGRTNNQMLKLIMQVRGRFTKQLLRRAQFSSQHFDDDANFVQVDTDKVTGKVRGVELIISWTVRC